MLSPSDTLLAVILHPELSRSNYPAAATVGAFSRDKRVTSDGTLGPTDAAAELNVKCSIDGVPKGHGSEFEILNVE